MIRTVADLLAGILRRELVELDKVDIKHAPTIGDMYEGLSAHLLSRAIPDGLGLKIVSGFATDGLGNFSGQLDCMLVRGDGQRLRWTDSHVWHVKDIIAVIEIKKNLYSAELRDAFAHLRTVQAVENSYFQRANESDEAIYDTRPAQRTFSEMTGKFSPDSHEAESLPYHERAIYHTLILEQVSSIRIILGLHGFKSEQAFRKALTKYLEDNIGIRGYGVSSFPQLIISGNYAAAKANGRPYTTRLVGEWWPFYFTSPSNPLLLLLELIWTRLDEMYGLGPGVWGEDLVVQVGRGLLAARATQASGRNGWEVRVAETTSKILSETPEQEPWQPRFVALEEFVVLARLTEGIEVRTDDPQLVSWLGEQGVSVDVLRERLLQTGLVAAAGSKLELVTTSCQLAVLPTGEYVAAENSTGRLTRWLEKEFVLKKDTPST